ncbi:DUF4229 domain-containing protein [Microbacterium sp. ZXX196]|uniref:DUF4229 domain-containing protein n=1 Tax=Microbacterium sp. ZXX196 TaxID=2609291 RepID=UPI001328E2ED|nr:DUF4229 domain-containing protein [Microbacterium sp. ZXX196]
MKIRSVLSYSLLRLAFFAVPLGVMLLFPVFWDLWWLAVIFATLIGLSLSIIFLGGKRAEVSAGLADRQARRQTPTAREADDELEDAANAEAMRESGSEDPRA